MVDIDDKLFDERSIPSHKHYGENANRAAAWKVGRRGKPGGPEEGPLTYNRLICSELYWRIALPLCTRVHAQLMHPR